MTGTASPTRATTPPAHQAIDAASGEDSPLSSLSAASVDDSDAPPPAATAPEGLADRATSNTNGFHDAELPGPEPKPLSNGQNGDHADDAAGADSLERPAKRRRTKEADPAAVAAPVTPSGTRKPKYISPPWKKVEAEGPSTFKEGGRRKSGRINAVPLELQSGDKRITRRAVQVHNSPPSSAAKPGAAPAAANTHATRRLSSSASTHPTPGLATPSIASTRRAAVASTTHKKPQARNAANTNGRASSFSASRARPGSASSPPQRPSRAAASRAQPSRSAASSRPQRDRGPSKLEMPTRTTPRIRLRTRTLTIPIVHPDQTKTRPKLASDLSEYFSVAAEIPVEEGGLLASEDGPRMTDEMAVAEVAAVARIERETEPGGLLTAPRCTVFEPETTEEPPRQWAHMDHLTKAMANFRKLMAMEQQRHRATAKKLAEACRDEWIRRQPKSAEQLEAEARAMWIGRYRIVVRAMLGTWENVKAEINRRRLQEWEAEEQRRVKAALQEAVALSELKLQARRTKQLDSEEEEDDDDDDDLDNLEDEDLEDDEGENTPLDSAAMSVDSDGGSKDGSDSDDDDNEHNSEDDDDESNMSSSDEDEDEDKEMAASVASDEGLTQAQLRQKYADLPDVKKAETNGDGPSKASPGPGPAAAGEDGEETSDESVDMDDDLGSTDMDSDDEDDEDSDGVNGSGGDNETSSDEGEEASGLLGMLFAKSELKKLKVEPDTKVPTETPAAAAPKDDPSSPTNGDVKMADADGPEEGTLLETTKNTSDDGAASPAEQDDDGAAASPETDGVTTAVSPGQSQSPQTLDTKPSDLDTPQSAAEGDQSLLAGAAPKETDAPASADAVAVSRSASPGAAAATTPSAVATTATSAPKTPIPFLLRGTLREYQHYGLDWLAGLYANNTNGILADEMGLGKTIQTIALLAHLACEHEVWGPHLVIVPTSVILNWEMEFKKWCPAFKILTYYGNQEERKRKRIGWTNDDIWNVCITSYQIVVQDQQVFKRRRWHYMILDEAHNIKNFKSQRWQSLLGFNTHSRLLLTGTPLQNNLTELWSLLFFLMPPENGLGGFADLHEFHDWFHKPESQILESGREQMDEEARAIIAKLHQVLRPYLLRRLKADVEKQMPAKYEHVELCRLSKRQRELYDGFLARNDTRATLSSGNYLSIINCLMQLRKVCNHPDLFVDRPIMTSFRMRQSVPAAYEAHTVQRVQRHLWAKGGLGTTVSLQVLNLVPTQQEWWLSASTAAQINQLATNRVLADLRDAQRGRLPQPYPGLDASTVQSNLAFLENAARWQRFEELQHCTYLNALRRQQRPVYGTGLVELLTLHTAERPFRARPRVPAQIMAWFEDESFVLRSLVQPLGRRAAGLETTISKFACVTPAVVTRDMNGVLLGQRGAAAFAAWDLRLAAPVKTLPFLQRQAPRDPWHEARMRLTVQFPDKRLLQFDCGKLQALDRLLRRLQAGGHRALIFTQMTKVLDILEQFLNIHGHKYLRLDGATKIEQRQILTDRFNHDNRILCFILSTRSGGLGINLTGADTVIFYDQDWNPAMDKQCQDRCHRIGQTRDVHIYRLVSEHTIEANILRKASQKQMLDDVVIQEGGFTTDYFNKIRVRDVLDGGDGAAAAAGAGAGDGDAAAAAAAAAANRLLGEAAANAAMDRVLGGVETATDPRTAGRVLEQVEDREDVTAARLAEKEILQDDADFLEQQRPAAATTTTATTGATAAVAGLSGAAPSPADGSGVSSVRQGTPREGPSGLGDGQAQHAAAAAAAVGEQNAWGEPMHTIDDYMLGWMTEMLKGTALELPKDRKRGKKKKGKDTRKR